MAKFIINASAAQVYLFAGILIFFWIAELIFCLDDVKFKWAHSKLNIVFMLSALVIQLSTTPFLVMVSKEVTAHHFGLINWVPYHTFPLVRILVSFLMLDMCEYIYHVIMHKLKMFWKFHLVHHSDQDVDVTTTVREHPVETCIRVCFSIFWVFICGAGMEAIILRQSLGSICNIMAHTKFRMSGRLEKVAGWIFITPNLHHVHHHYELPHTDCNYGDVLSIWDRIFGTFAELEASKTTFGIDSHMHIDSGCKFMEVMAIPFKKSLDEKVGTLSEQL